MMNLNNLTLEELENYILNGVIESVPASLVLEILEKKDADCQAKLRERGSYDEGWRDAVDEMRGWLENM